MLISSTNLICIVHSIEFFVGVKNGNSSVRACSKIWCRKLKRLNTMNHLVYTAPFFFANS